MKKNYIARRRGTSVAAAALSFALVAPLAQPVAAPQFAAAAFAGTKDQAGQPNEQGNGVLYPGENADGVYQTGVAQEKYVVGDQPIKVDGAIESEVPAGSNNSIEGYVINKRNGNISMNPGTNNLKPIPMEGVRIYAQWVERDGVISPIYTATTDETGRFSIGMANFTDASGKLRTFDADSSLPEGEKFRIWAENPDPDVFTQLYGSGQGKLFPLGNTMELSAGMRNLVGSDRLENARFAFGEKAQNDVMHNLDASVENAPWKQPSVNAYGQVTGKVHWDLTRATTVAGWGDYTAYNKADVPAKGMKVYGSYLSDYALGQIYNEAEKDLGFAVPKSDRRGLSRDQEAALQNWIKRKIAEEGKDKWIAETTEAIVGEDGDYTLQFKGTFGKAWDDRGYDDGALIYTDLAREDGAEATFPDGSTHKAYDLFNTVAPAADYGSWMSNASGRGGENLPKHINWNWLFVSTEDIDGAAVVTPFHTNAYTGRTNVSTDQLWAGVWNYAQAGRLANNNIGLYPDYTVFDVLEYDTQQNYAKPGDKAETKTSGLPSKFVEGLKYEIEWVNTETGEVVHKCEAKPAKGDTTIDSCPLDTGDKNLFPDGITKTTTFAANLYPVKEDTGERGDRIATDAFTVLVDWAPEYEQKEGKAGEPLNSDAPTFDRTDTDEVEKLTAEQLTAEDADKQPTKFELPETFTVPEGYDISVDEVTGAVSLTFPKGTAPGTTIDVPVKVTYKDGTTATGVAPFKVASLNNDTFEPVYEDVTGKPGQDSKVPAPRFKDEDGNSTTAPDGTKFTPGENAPDGVAIDSKTGEITVKVPEDAKPGDKITVPVDVTYPDGSFETVDVTVAAVKPNPTVKPGENTTVPADGGDHNVGKVENPTGDEEGKLVDKDGNEIPGSKVEIDEDGNVKVTVPEGTDPQGAKVIVTDKDGNSIGEIDVNVVDLRSDASRNVPNYGDRKNVEAGKTEKSDPFEGKTDVPVKEAKGKPSAGSEDWTFKTGETNGVVEATAPGYDKVAEKIESELPNIDSSWEKFKEIFTPYVRPSVDVDFEYNDGSKNSATAGFDLVGKDGKSLLDPDGDFDGDGISNKDEIEGGKNPAAADEGDNTDTTAPTVDPVKPGDKKITGKDDRPNSEITVTFPDGTEKKVTTDKDGNWSVDVPTDIDLKPADRIRVADGAGNTTEATVGPAALEPLLTDQFDPVYPRAYVRVGESATSVTPNLTRYVNGREFRRQPLRTAGNVAFKVDAPGTLKNNGRVEVTAPKDAQPGDLITVPVQVTYADGTTDKTEAIFEVIPGAYAEMYDPKYEVGRSASPGEQTQVKQVGDNDLPEGTTFTLDRDKSDLNGWGIQVDETTGLITATAPQSREHRAEVVVTVSYADGSQQSITAFVDPQAATSMAETIPVKDALVTVPVGVALDATVVPALPDGTTFDVGAFSDENWSVDVNKDTGEVTVVTTDKVQPNDQVVVPVVVKFPDGSETTVNVTVVATKPQTTQHQPVYVASKVAPGERTSLQLSVPLDKKVGATYSLAGNAAGLKAEIDPETGVITVQADAGAKPGTRVLPVDVRYADGSVERIQARVEVTGTGVTANPACDDGSSNSSTSSTSSTSSESCTTGSSTGGVVAIILGVLAVIGGAAWAAFINQDAVRDVLRNFGIKF